jgi:hypothetical protein
VKEANQKGLGQSSIKTLVAIIKKGMQLGEILLLTLKKLANLLH